MYKDFSKINYIGLVKKTWAFRKSLSEVSIFTLGVNLEFNWGLMKLKIADLLFSSDSYGEKLICSWFTTKKTNHVKIPGVWRRYNVRCIYVSFNFEQP